MEKAMAPHSSTLAWKIPWTEEPGKLQSMGLLRVRHVWATSLSLFTFMHWRRKWQPCLENPRDGGAWWAAINGVTQSRTRLKWLSSSRTNKRKTTRWSLRLLLSWQKLNEFWRIRSPYTFQPHVSYKSEEVPSILISFSIFVKERMNIYLLPYPTQ